MVEHGAVLVVTDADWCRRMGRVLDGLNRQPLAGVSVEQVPSLGEYVLRIADNVRGDPRIDYQAAEVAALYDFRETLGIEGVIVPREMK